MTRPLRTLLVAAAGMLAPLLAQAQPVPEPPGAFTLVFVGGAAGDERSPTLERLRSRLIALDPARAVVVFTGNYSVGELPPEGHQGRPEGERDLLAHVSATEGFVDRGGKVYFLPGHRDFAEGGTRAIRRTRKFLNQAYRVEVDVMPKAGCGDPVVLELTDELGLVLLNSQWWMQDWLHDPEANQGCLVKSREAFRMRVRDAFNEYRTRRLIVASHHPLESYGELGGGFSARAHLTPAPIVGSVGVLAREAGLVPQYVTYPLVRSYLELLTEEAERYGAFVFASGHDASLQVLKVERQLQIVSGSSALKGAPTAAPEEGEFAASAPGWAELAIDRSGGGRVRLVSEGRILFEAPVPPPAPYPAASGQPPPLPRGPVLATLARTPGRRLGAVTKLLIGSFYSDAYTLELPWEVLDLDTEQGGLRPVKTGGSLQTNSLSLRDPQGAAWTMRATTKDPSRFFGKQEGEGASVTVSHAFTAIHPEAALSVPRLAEAFGVLHASPRLLYLPDQPGLGRYRGYLGDELVLLERTPKQPDQGVLPESLAGPPSPAGPTRFRTTDELRERLARKPARYRVDQEAMLRARLLDVFIGDWDRHQGQWRFAERPNPDGTRTYRPIPRDRDQVFSNYDGLALRLGRIPSWPARVLQPFDGSYRDVGWLIYGARDLDAALLNQLPRERWLEIAAEVKAAVTDEVIDEALSTWHRETYLLDGARIAAALKLRRDQLDEVAEQFFALINERVDVLGSTGDDRFELVFEPGGAVRVSVGGRDGPRWFERVFRPGETSQLRLYGLDGADLLSVSGAPHRQIDIRFVGGEGADRVAGPEGQRLRATAVRLYDAEQGAVIEPTIQVRDERSSLAWLNQYDPTENHEPDTGAFIPGLRANPDEGALLAGAYTQLIQGYKKRPFAARHEVLGSFATATLGAVVEYRGLFPQSLGLLDQQLELAVKAPTHTRNFFGFTNQYVESAGEGNAEPLDFYRVRQPGYDARYGLAWGFGGDRSRVGGQLVNQGIYTEPTEGRFVTSSTDVAADALGFRWFGGVRLFGQTHTFDRLVHPTRGVGFELALETRVDLRTGAQLSTSYRVGAAAAIPLGRERRFVLLTRGRLEGIAGAHPFYFAPTLGAAELRAYHSNQLAGELALSQTTDLRIDVLRSLAVMPGTLGVNLSADHGRVFGPSIATDHYHLSLGGSVWWSMMDTFVLSLGYYRSLDGAGRLSLMLGPLFAPAAI